MSNVKRLPLFVLGDYRKGPLISLVGRVLLAIAYSVVILGLISAALGSWFYLVATPIPILASYLFWYPQYRREKVS
jgi:hypothetical protein